MKNLEFNNNELIINEVVSDENGHDYKIFHDLKINEDYTQISFLKNGRNTPEHIPGVQHEALLRIVMDRLEMFIKSTDNPDPANVAAFHYVAKALEICENRTKQRHDDGVLGNNGEDRL